MSRRLLRAGWLIAPIFSLPGAAWRMLKAIWPLVVISCMSGAAATFAIYDVERSKLQYADAPVAKIKAAAASPCMSQQIAYQLSLGRTISHYHLDVFAGRCSNELVVRAQQEALK